MVSCGIDIQGAMPGSPDMAPYGVAGYILLSECIQTPFYFIKLPLQGIYLFNGAAVPGTGS